MNKTIKIIAALTALSIIPPSVIANDKWKNTVSLSALTGFYYQSYIRDRYAGGGISFSGDYLDQGGFTVKASSSTIQYNHGYDDIDQSNLFLSGRYNFFPDSLNGKIATRTDIYYLDNNDATGNSDKVSAIAPQFTYIPYSKDFSIGLGVAYTKYQNDLSVTQVTPNAGFAFNNKMGWLNIGGYFITPDNPARAMNIDSTEAATVSVTHWLAKDNYLPINFLTASLMVGERIYAVDNEAASIYNVLDIQEGTVSAGCSWDLGSEFSLLSIVGHEKFRDINIDDEYSSNFLFLKLSKSW